MFWILLRKELLIEFRSKEVTVSMLTFGLTVILVFAFAFNVSPGLFSTFAPGLFWVLTIFISILGLNRMFAYEREFDAFSLMISGPVDRGMIFLVKWFSGTLLLIITDFLVIPPFILFLQINLSFNLGLACLVILLGNTGIMVIGSLVSGLAMRAKLSEVLVPILILPLSSPIIIAATKSTVAIFNNVPAKEWQIWLMIMGTFILSFGLIGYLIFDHIVEE